MNKYGIMSSAVDGKVAGNANYFQIAINWLRARRTFLLVVVAPTLILAGYLYFIAADQYQSEAHFVIRAAEAPQATPSGVGQLLGLTGGMTNSASAAASVSDYLTSHDAVEALRTKVDLVACFRRPGVDFFSKLRSADPTPESLLKYYRGKIGVGAAHDSDVTVLTVKAFRKEDAYNIIQQLLLIGERRVNDLNTRSYQDSITMARKELAQSEEDVATVQARMTSFRQTHGDIDPQASGEAQIKLVSGVNASLVAARAQLNTMGSLISHSSPQYVALSRQVQSLQAQATAQSGLAAGAGGSASIASSLGGYEDLRLRQQFAAQHYQVAAANLEKALDQAQRQQLYLVRVVQPNVPVKALFPERGRIVLTALIGLLLAYSLGWLLAAGVREHATQT